MSNPVFRCVYATYLYIYMFKWKTYTHYGPFSLFSISPSFYISFEYRDREVGTDTNICTLCLCRSLAVAAPCWCWCCWFSFTIFLCTPSPSYPYVWSFMFTLFWFWCWCHRYRCTVFRKLFDFIFECVCVFFLIRLDILIKCFENYFENLETKKSSKIINNLARRIKIL